MNKPVAWMYRVNNSFNTFSTIDPPDDAYDKGTLVPLYTQDQLEEARKLGMQQERALWNLAESTQEFESFDRTASHMAGEYVAHPAELTDEEIIKTMVQFDVYSDDDQCLIEAAKAILRKTSK